MIIKVNKKKNKRLSVKYVKDFFSNKNLYKSYLFVEKKFSLTQGNLNIIPKKSSIEISKKCNIKYINIKSLERDIKKTNAPIVSLVNLLTKICSKETQKYIHYGATTHNIIQTGLTLVLRDSHIQSMYRLSECLTTLSVLSKRFSNLTMIARTNGQHAMPITFGFKISEWSEIILRFEQRFHEIEKRLFILIFGGAVGAMHSFRDKKQILYKNLCKQLNLNQVDVSSRAIIDNMAEYVLLCSHLGSALENIGKELSFYMREEIQEVSENLNKGVVGSSSMPQKINPKYVYSFIAKSKEMKNYVMNGLTMMDIQNEGDLGTQYFQIKTIKEISPKLCVLLEEFNELLKILNVNSKNMEKNLEITNGLIHSENISMSIAPMIGKQNAYKIIKNIINKVRAKNKDFEELVYKDKNLKKILSKKEIKNLLNSKFNIGNSYEIANKVSKKTKIRASKLYSRIKKINQILTS